MPTAKDQFWRVVSVQASRWAGVAVLLVGAAGLVGWWADIVALRIVAPGLAPMKPNTALCLALCGVGLAAGPGIERTSRFRVLCGVVCTVVCLLTLAEYSLGLEEGTALDRVLIGTRYPDGLVRMTVGAAVALTCSGIGLVMTAWPPRPPGVARSIESSIALTALLIGLLALLGYIYGVRSLYRTAIYPSMALHTAATLALIGASLLLSRPRQGLARLIGSDGPGGKLARRLLGFFILLAPFIGWLCLRGERATLYDAPFGIALLVWVMIALGLATIWSTARALDVADEKRSSLQEDLAHSITREAESAAQRGSILEALPIAIALLDQRGGVLAVNHRWKGVGAETPCTVGEEFVEWAGRALGAEKEAWWTVTAGVWGVLSGARASHISEFRVPMPEKATTKADRAGERWLEVRVAPVQSTEGSKAPGSAGVPGGAVVAVADITQRRRLEDQLVHAQRLEAVGRLAGGVAHDFNNLLTAVTGHCTLARASLAAGGNPEPNLQAIEQAARSGAELTQDLLAFGRRQVLATRVVSIDQMIAGVRRLLERTLGESVSLRIETPRAVWPVKVDPARIEQVLMNLVINARDAIPGGATARPGAQGAVVIEAANTALKDGDTADRTGVAPGSYVCISVSDNGIGMNKQVLARLFEPFFTTKEQGKGTGLGLATSFGIVKQHGGHIEVYSEEGRGTTFRVYLPAVLSAAAEPLPAEPVARIEGGSERILLVDDHPGARAAVAGMLASLGYTVVEAGTVAQAELAASAEDARFDLLISDVVLPDGDGPHLAERIARASPTCAVLFISGYTANAIVTSGELDPSVNFLSKPFSLADLAAKVRSVIDGHCAR